MRLSLQQEFDLLGPTYVANGIACFEAMLAEIPA